MAGDAARAGAATVGRQLEKKSKRQPSRKGKKAWRANIDIADVEDGLEEAREDERVGDLTGLPDSSIFVLDGDRNSQLNKPARKSLWRDTILTARSAVPAVTSRSRVEKRFKGPVLVKGKPQMSKNTRKAIAKLLRSGAAASLAKGKIRTDSLVRANKTEAAFDLWAEGDSGWKGQKKSPGNEFISPAKKVPVKVPKSMLIKPTRLTAVETAHLGASYQAPESARKELIALAGAVELKKENERVQLAELQAKFFRNGSSEGLNDMLMTNEEPESEGEEQDEETLSTERKEQKRKTGAQRRRTARQKQLEREAEVRKEDRKTKSILESLKKLAKDADKAAATKAEELARRKMLRKQRDAMPKRKLGKYHVLDDPLDVQLDGEVADSLRRLKPEGNLFLDRFISFQKRNLIEPRVRVKHRRRYKLKEYEPPSSKYWIERNQ